MNVVQVAITNWEIIFPALVVLCFILFRLFGRKRRSRTPAERYPGERWDRKERETR